MKRRLSWIEAKLGEEGIREKSLVFSLRMLTSSMGYQLLEEILEYIMDS